MKKTTIILLLMFFFPVKGFTGEILYYSGIPGCDCFMHCNCFSCCVDSFPGDKRYHPFALEDKIWHEFMKKFLSALKEAPPFIPHVMTYPHRTLSAASECGYICLLSEYLNAVDKLERTIEQTRIDTIKMLKNRLYSDPKDREEFLDSVNWVNRRAASAYEILSSIPLTIIPMYKELVGKCKHHQPYNMARVYNKGLIGLLEGNIEESLTDICSFIEMAKKNGKEKFLTSECFQKQGEAFFEVGLYNLAIEALNQAIVKDPNNLEAYFQRASAYFEVGDFEHSLEDYLHSEKSGAFAHYQVVPSKFIDAFSKAALNGAFDAASDFVPSLCHTAYGLGKCLWAFGEHPIGSIQNLASAGYGMVGHIVDFLRNVDKETLNECADEIVRLFENFNQLTDREKGELLGYTIGKYGVDIFAGTAAIKSVSAFKKLKEANRICNLESMAFSITSKESVTSSALKQYAERCRFFENNKIHWGKQNKHIPGKPNYKEGKSIFEHQDPETLLNKFAGTGTPKRGCMGQAGYQEVVDFKEPIGIWKNMDGTKSLPTTKGVIHYANDGAHIVPENPEFLLW